MIYAMLHYIFTLNLDCETEGKLNNYVLAQQIILFFFLIEFIYF